MQSIEGMKEKIETSLTPKRYNHSLGVADEAVRLAKKWGCDTQKSYIAGILHDVAKEIPLQESLELCRKHLVTLSPLESSNQKLIHAPLGARLAQIKFGVDDAEILDAIRFHTTAKADMPMLTKVLYIADYIEPNRDFDGVDMLRSLAYSDIDSAIFAGLDYTISQLISEKKVMHPDTVSARNFLISDI